MADTDFNRSRMEDGVRQTTATTRQISVEDNIKMYKFADISVPPTFKYKNLLHNVPSMHSPPLTPQTDEPPSANSRGLMIYYKRKFKNLMKENVELKKTIKILKKLNKLK